MCNTHEEIRNARKCQVEVHEQRRSLGKPVYIRVDNIEMALRELPYNMWTLLSASACGYVESCYLHSNESLHFTKILRRLFSFQKKFCEECL